MSGKIKFSSFVIALLAITVMWMSNPWQVYAKDEINLPVVKKQTLKNGLLVMVIEHHELPVVSFRMAIKTGATYDPETKAGLANFTSGLLRQGTKTKKATQISEEIDFIGGDLGANADWDWIQANCTVLKKYFDTGLNLLSDIVLNPAFSEDEIERLRKQTISGIMQSKDDPNTVTALKFNEYLFGKHPYAHPVQGTEESVTSFTRDDVVKFHQTYFIPNNAILCVAGDVTPAEVFTKIEQKFGSWKKGTPPVANFPEPPAFKGYNILLVNKPDLTQTYITLGHMGVDRSNPDYFPLRLMNYMLGGGGFASRLMQEVRAKKGLTYGIYCDFTMQKLRGDFYVSTFTRNDSTLAAIKATLDELRRIKTEKVPEKELSDAKSFYTGYFPLRFETPDQIALQMIFVEIYNLGENYLKDYRNNINKVTVDDIQRVAQKYLDPENLKFCVVSKASEVKPLLVGLGQIEETTFLK